MQMIAPSTVTTLTVTFRDSNGTKVSVTSPAGDVFDFANTSVLSLTSGDFTEVTTGIYSFDLDTSTFSDTGTYRIVVNGVYGSGRIYSDGPILFQLAATSAFVTYVSPNDLISYLQLEEPVDIKFLQDVAYAATDVINKYTERTFMRQTATDEKHFVEGAATLFLNNYPVISITSLKIGTAAQTLTNYEYNLSLGQINFGTETSGEITITYVHGTDTLPQDVNLAAKKIAAFYFQRRSREGVRSERLLGYSYTLQTDALSEVKSILKHYKHARIV